MRLPKHYFGNEIETVPEQLEFYNFALTHSRLRCVYMGEITDKSPAISPVKLHQNATPQTYIFTCAVPMPKPQVLNASLLNKGFASKCNSNDETYAIPMSKPMQNLFHEHWFRHWNCIWKRNRRRNCRRIVTDFAHVNALS